MSHTDSPCECEGGPAETETTRMPAPGRPYPHMVTVEYCAACGEVLSAEP